MEPAVAMELAPRPPHRLCAAVNRAPLIQPRKHCQPSAMAPAIVWRARRLSAETSSATPTRMRVCPAVRLTRNVQLGTCVTAARCRAAVLSPMVPTALRTDNARRPNVLRAYVAAVWRRTKTRVPHVRAARLTASAVTAGAHLPAPRMRDHVRVGQALVVRKHAMVRALVCPPIQLEQVVERRCVLRAPNCKAKFATPAACALRAPRSAAKRASGA